MRARLLIALLLSTQLVTAQVNIHGIITDSTGKPVNGASVTLVKKNGIILSFAITPASGLYELHHQTARFQDSLMIKVNVIGYIQQFRLVYTTEQKADFQLTASRNLLPEVSVNSRTLLRRSGDTLNYDVISFSEKQDRTIGDIIKKLPGIDVDEKGLISYGGKPINRLYIDNDNLLDGRYNIATRSIPTDAVAKIQVLENHQPVKVLKDVVHSEQAAINLVLNNKARLRLIGTGDVAVGTPDIYNTSINMMLFQKKVKFINYGKLNNTGNDLADDITNFFSVDNNPAWLMSASTAGSPDISKKRSLFNNAGLATINYLFTLAKDLQLRFNMHFLKDKQFQWYNYHSALYLPNDTIQYHELLSSRKSINTFNTQFTLTANKDNYLLNNVTTLENAPQTIGANLVASGNGSIYQQFSGSNTNISNQFHLIQKTKRGNSYQLYSYINHISNPATLEVKPGLFASQLNAGVPYERLEQLGSVPTFYTDNYLSFGLLNTNIRQQYRVGLNYQDQQLNSTLLSEQISGNKQVVADSFINNVSWQKMQAYMQADYSYSTQKLVVSLSIPWLYQQIKYFGRKHLAELRNFPVTPKMNLRYNTNKDNFISFSYMYGNSWGTINEVYDGYIMRNYRDFYSNGDLLNQSRSHKFNASFDRRNAIKIFFFSLGASYNIIDRNTINQQQISSLVQQSKLIAFDNRGSSLSFNTSISKYLFPLMTTIGGKARWSSMQSLQYQNTELLKLRNYNYTLGWNTLTKFSNWLTISYTGSYTNSRSHFQDRTKSPVTPAVQRWQHAADAAITLGKKFTARLIADHYGYKLPGQSLNITFADALVTYYIDQLKSNIEFSFTNMMGTDTYSSIQLSANSVSEAAYMIRPRMAQLKFYFRF